MTPMSESIKQAANDFTFEPGRKNFIVLISDGEETCGDEPATVVQYLKEIGIDFAIHVIGLDVDAQTAAQLKGISDVAGGVYYDAKSEEDLNAALHGYQSDDAARARVTRTWSRHLQRRQSRSPMPRSPLKALWRLPPVTTRPILPRLAVDGDTSTSWFSAGTLGGDSNPTYVWTGLQDDFIASIDLISNREHQVVDFRTGYGFGGVTIQVLDAQGNVVFEESATLDGSSRPGRTRDPQRGWALRPHDL